MTRGWGRWAAILVWAAAGGATLAPVEAQIVPPLPDPGRISNETLRQQQQLQRENQFEGPGVVGPSAPPGTVGPSGGPSFFLKKVVFDHSEFLSTA